jgi:hypothetical protein
VGADFLIAAPVATTFLESGLSGLAGFDHVEPVSVRGTSTAPPGYVHVRVGIGSARIDEARSSIRRSGDVECDECRFGGTLDAVHGFAIAPDSWTGIDVFIARGLPGTPIVSERFKNWAEQEQLTAVRFTPTETFAWDSRPASTR